MPKEGYHRFLTLVTNDKSLEKAVLDQQTRLSTLENLVKNFAVNLDDSEITDMVNSTANKLSDLILDFNAKERYHDA